MKSGAKFGLKLINLCTFRDHMREIYFDLGVECIHAQYPSSVSRFDLLLVSHRVERNRNSAKSDRVKFTPKSRVKP